METTNILLALMTIGISVAIFLMSFSNRVAKLETKIDWLLEWVICIDANPPNDTKILKAKRRQMKHRIEDELNGECSDMCKD